MLYIVLIIRQLQCLLCPEVNIACTRFVQRFLRFSHPQTAQNNSQKFRLKNHNLSYKYNPAFSGLCKDIRVGHISKMTSEKSQIKFAKSERTGELIGFVFRDSKTRQLKGVRENYALGKQICVLAEE